MTEQRADIQRCKHNMLPGMCADCIPPRAAKVPVRRPESSVRASGAVETRHGFVVVRTAGGRDQVVRHRMGAVNETTRVVHIDGTPFLWAIEEILRRAPKLRTIQVIPSALPKIHPDSGLRICRERGVEVRAGHAAPELAWDEGRIVGKHFRDQQRFMRTLSGPQRALFDELVALGEEAALMANLYFLGDEIVTQAQVAEEFGLPPTRNATVSNRILAVLFYLDESMDVGEISKTKARGMCARVERLRPMLANAAARQELADDLCVPVLADAFPLARADAFRAVLVAMRNGCLDAVRRKDPRGAEAVALRFGLDALERGVYRTLAQVGEVMGGLTRERARQLEERALASLGVVE